MVHTFAYIHSFKEHTYKTKIKKRYYFHLYVYVWGSVCVYVPVYVGVFGSQKRTLDALELELQAGEGYMMWVAGNQILVLCKSSK